MSRIEVAMVPPATSRTKENRAMRSVGETFPTFRLQAVVAIPGSSHTSRASTAEDCLCRGVDGALVSTHRLLISLTA